MASAIMAGAADLTAKETAIVDIGTWTARGEQDKLGAAFKAGFDAGLTLNEAKELVGQGVRRGYEVDGKQSLFYVSRRGENIPQTKKGTSL